MQQAPALCRGEKGRQWVLRMDCGECLCVLGSRHLSAPGVPRVASSSGQAPEWREDADCAKPQEQRQDCGGANASVSALGPAGIREEHTGATVLRTGFLERKFEYVMDVGSVQHTFNSTNGQYMRIHSVQSPWGILCGNWRRVDVSSPLEV